MKCFNCGFINPDEARFCQNCGHHLDAPCPNCGTLNPANARFCANCGHNLGQSAAGPAKPAPADPRHVRLAAAAPPALVEKAHAAAHQPGERRVVTALFADVVDSTALAEQMDPEDWTGLMNRAFDALTGVVYRYEGTIARLMGDALLAFFGAPVAHEDDPLRAAHAALGLVEAAQAFAGEVRAQYGIDFAIRVGLNTGPVVVGEVGSSLVYEYTAMGDAVNLAARMQTAARPNTVFITENTYRQLADAFDCTDLGTIPVKGKTEPVHVFELGRPKQHEGRTRGLAGLAGQLVGRGGELSVLFKASRATTAGLGRAVLIAGEPGIGKSRLVSEWKLRLLAEPAGASTGIRWAEGHCLSYGQGMAYHLLIDLLYSLVEISPSAGDEEAAGALSALCADLFGSQAPEVQPYLAHLLSLPLIGEPLERVRVLDPQSLQAQYLASMRRLLLALAARQPLFITLEDIHWADPSSVDLLIRLLPLVSEAALLFCLVTRAERDVPGWKLVQAARDLLGASLVEVDLPPLTQAESQQLVTHLLDAAALPEEIRSVVLDKAEGNPLFVEEVIRMLLDRGFIAREGATWRLARAVESADIPDNLQSLLLARIDRLPDDVKQTLRVAAVIGRQFPVRVLQEVLRRQETAA
ncbi:MAG TPA: adenylate/guanylate cyclase domain-containing protein [Anaerolineaceae bacterium]